MLAMDSYKTGLGIPMVVGEVKRIARRVDDSVGSRDVGIGPGPYVLHFRSRGPGSKELNRGVGTGTGFFQHFPRTWVDRWPVIDQEKLHCAVFGIAAREADELQQAIASSTGEAGSLELAELEAIPLGNVNVNGDDGITSRASRNIEIIGTRSGCQFGAYSASGAGPVREPGVAPGSGSSTWASIFGGREGRSRPGTAGASTRTATCPRMPAVGDRRCDDTNRESRTMAGTSCRGRDPS